MFRKTLLTLALAAAPALALAQQPAQTPAKPAHTQMGRADSTKAKPHRARRTTRAKPSGAPARKDTTAHRDTTARP